MYYAGATVLTEKDISTGERARKVVIALGGNAISSGDGSGDIASQFAQSRVTAKYIGGLLVAGHHVLLVHGNGPQVGMVLRRVELSRHEVYPIDLGLCVADTQAGMGYMICQCVRNEMIKRGFRARACTIVTTVSVDQRDPAFSNPTKPIGQFYKREEIADRIVSEGWNVIDVPGRGVRRVVPSPVPQEIRELELIHHLFDEGRVVVCCGGGGIPVVATEDGLFEGIEAVIDKDLTASLLAIGTDADSLAILTDVERVCLNYGKPNEKPLDQMTVSEAEAYLKDGQFPAGSMGPKIQACISYMRGSNCRNAQAIITSIEGCAEALEGKNGTRIVLD